MDNNNLPKKNFFSTQIDLSKFDMSRFAPATDEEKAQQDVMRKSTTFFKDGFRRLFKNPLAVMSIIVLALIAIIIIVAPFFIPYSYEEMLAVDGNRDKEAQNLAPMTYSENEERYIIEQWLGDHGMSFGQVRNLTKKSIKEFSADELKLFFGTDDIKDLDWVVSDMITIPQSIEALEKPVKDLNADELGVVFGVSTLDEVKALAEKKKVSLDTALSVKEYSPETQKALLGVNTPENLKKKVKDAVREIQRKAVSENEPFSEYSQASLQLFMKKSVMKNGEIYGYRFPHLFGTDEQCRDYFIRVVYGTRVSLLVGIFASLVVLIIGMLYGSISGYIGGKVDLVMMRIVDIIYSLPDMLIIILLSVVLDEVLKIPSTSVLAGVGTNMISLFIVFGLLYWVGMARLIRGQILSIKQNEYILAAKSIGAKPGWIIRKHILPNCLSVIIISTALQIPSAIFTESYLSFVGFVVKAPMPSLGSLANAARGGLQSYPYKLMFPAIVICLIVLSLNLLGDGLRDAFDPKLKK